MSVYSIDSHEITGAFETAGTWWLPESPDEKFGGVLSYNGTARIRLELFGQPAKSYPDLILGSCKGGPCTLIKPRFCADSWSRDGASTTTFEARFLITGYHYTDLGNAKPKSATAEFGALAWWLDPNAVLRLSFSESELSLASNPDCDLNVDVPELEAKLRIGNYFGRSSKGDTIELQHRGFCSLVPYEPQSIYWYVMTIASIQHFLSLLIGDTVSLRRVQLFPANKQPAESEQVLVGNLYYSQGRVESGRRGVYFLPYPEVKNILPALLRSWFRWRELFQPVLGLFFTTFAHPLYVESAFLSLVQAIEGFHRRVFPDQYVEATTFAKIKATLEAAIPEDVPGELRQALRERLRYANEYSLRRRIKELLRSIDEEIRKRIYLNIDEFSSKVVEYRNQLVHCPKEFKRSGYMMEDMSFLANALQAYLTVLILKHIGIPEAVLRKAIQLRPLF